MAPEAAPGNSPAETCRIAEADGGRTQVLLSGALHSGWAGRLAAALAARRVSVVRGRGIRRSGHLWDIELLLEPLDRGVSLADIDYLALAREGRTPAEASDASLELESFSLQRTADDLIVDLEGVDGLGFLDRVLRVFAFYSLFPRELHLETRGPKVKDRFHLQGLGGQAPSLQVCEAVGLKLRALAGPQAQ